MDVQSPGKCPLFALARQPRTMERGLPGAVSLLNKKRHPEIIMISNMGTAISMDVQREK